MPTKEDTTTGFHDLLKGMIAGIPKLPPGVTSLTILGTTYDMPGVTAKLASIEAKYAATEALEMQAKASADARDADAPTDKLFAKAAKRAIKTAVGPKSAALATVGIAPEKTPAPLTVEQQAAKVAKAKATRVARHTMGPKQKAKIKGEVPPTTPATPAPTAAGG